MAREKWGNYSVAHPVEPAMHLTFHLRGQDLYVRARVPVSEVTPDARPENRNRKPGIGMSSG